MHPHKCVGPRTSAITPAHVCWPWSPRIHTNTGLLALEQLAHSNTGLPGVISRTSAQVYWLRLQTMFSHTLAALQSPQSKGAGGRGEAFIRGPLAGAWRVLDFFL